MDLYKFFVRPILFQIDPDFVHEAIVNFGHLLGKSYVTRSLLKRLYSYSHPSLKTKVFGIEFDNPVGIGGGFDKNGRLTQVLPCVGFGFLEIGSITAKPYRGNPKPWNVRLKSENSIIVNYGLKNEGVDLIKKRLKREKREIPWVINIAKTNDIQIKGDDSVTDYENSFKKLQSLADIINVNISCPNTGDGVRFCESLPLLNKLLKKISQNKVYKPVVLKLKPDIDESTVNGILRLVKKYPIVKGFIVSNLTTNRRNLKSVTAKEIEKFNGGLSGKPLEKLSNALIKNIYRKTKGRYPIIGLGGIFTAEDAYEKICLGASLVELVTGLIYGGPSTIKTINRGIVKLLQKDGFKNISEAVGSKNSF
ncbi:MAG: quinone-dependent dihydroorotate dehydrogenase [Actinobacteria bacterium]|nr:quinone-dependent dihydroorotate dehydrogenase [Actinomycetota bacterium]